MRRQAHLQQDATDVISEIIQAVGEGQNFFIPAEIAKLPFGHAVWPWMSVACKKLEAIAGNSLARIHPQAYFSMQKTLAEKWSTACAPSMTLEMHIAAQKEALEGQTSGARYRGFIRQRLWRRESLQAFFQEYKGLIQFVETYLQLWVEQWAEFLHRLDQDSSLLERIFNHGRSLEIVVSIQPHLGDSHHRGRFVSMIQFTSGCSVVYKPKDLRGAATFQTLIDELNALGLPCKLQSYRIIPRDQYGWEECIHHFPCKTQREVDWFFQRAGMLLCLFYLLRGIDVHDENLIAAGEFPLLVDMETLFSSSRLNRRDSHYSVFETGFLPQRLYGRKGKKWMDVSGLTGKSGQTIPYPMPIWKKLNSDQMHQILTFKKQKHRTCQHLCFFREKPISAFHHIEPLLEGFQEMHRFIHSHRNDLLKKSSTLSKMASFPVRTILRPTRLYDRIQRSFFSPEVLRNEELEKGLLVQLSTLSSPRSSFFTPSILEEEKLALLQGDIPYFYTLPQSKDLYASGKLIASNYLTQAPYQEFLQGFLQSDAQDCQTQVANIRHAFAEY